MNDNKKFENLKKKIINKKFSVGIIGLGYVGLPICSRFVKANIKVFGVDIKKRENVGLTF